MSRLLPIGAGRAIGGGMTSSELTNLILSRLVRMEGGTRQRWRRALGEMRIYSIATHPHCNWDVRPTGSSAEHAAIERMLDWAREAHPQVSAD